MAADPIVEEVRSRLDLVQLVSEYLQLAKAGVRFRAPCPFHSEKDPSFYVNPDRQRYHCFGCGEDGDAFEFVMKMEGMDFPGALKHLAQKAGVKLPERSFDPQRKAKAEFSDRLFEANKMAAQFWHEVLLKHPAAETIRKYARERRNLDDNTIDEFMVGYAPDSWEATVKFLKTKEFSDREIAGAGLASTSSRGTLIDRFRNRLMFPIRDAQGQYVGFTGRVMPGPDGKDPDGEAKYINTAQTEIYHKESVLFAFDLAKQDIRKTETVVVVEGNMDAVASHQAGVRNVVASSGTAFTDKQLSLLKRLADKIILSFDADTAGEKAARRSIELANAAGFEVRVLRLPPDAGKDPDDAIRKDPEIWKKAIAEAVPFMEWYLSMAQERTDFRDPYDKARASSGLLEEIAKLQTPVERSHWLKRVSELFDTPEWALAEEMKQLAKGGPSRFRHNGQPPAPAGKSLGTNQSQGASAPPPPRDRRGLLSEYLVGIASNWPELSQKVIDGVLPEQLEEGLAPLYTALIIHYNESRTDGQEMHADRPVAFRPGDTQTGQRLAVLELLAEKEFGEMTADERAAATARLVGEIKQLHADRRRRQLAAEMAQAERDNDSARVADIQRQLEELIV